MTSSADDWERELAELRISPGARLRTGPVRRVVSRVTGALGGVASVAGFYRAAAAAVPVHQLLMGITLGAFAVQKAAGEAAMYSGARINGAIRAGQWHRLFSPVFLHGGVQHLLSNLYSLWRIGPLVESSFGSGATLLLFLAAGLGGNLAGLVWGGRAMSVGASGAVFGLMGSVLAFVWRNKRALGSSGDALVSAVGQVLFLNLYLGSRPGSGVDNLAHLGGLAAGLFVGLLVAPGPAAAPVGRWGRSSPGLAPAALPPAAVRALLYGLVAAYALAIKDAVGLGRLVRRRVFR
jgi:membrane associated rhomboid family serine protease